MKKFITVLVAISMISTPAIAREPRGRDRGDYNHRERDRGNKCGWLCGALIGGVVVGAIASSKRDRDYDREYDNQYYPPEHRYDRRYCVQEQITEWYRGERYVYWETRCN